MIFTAIWNVLQSKFEESPLIALCTIYLLGLLVYYQRLVVKPVILHCKKTSRFGQFLHENLSILQEEYKPTFWCFESRIQTVFASILRKTTIPDIEYKREILKLFDGGEISLDWVSAEDANDSSPICLFLPGLTGDSQSEYIKSFVNIGRFKLGARCVVFNNRGRGGIDLKTPRTYCASNSEDLAAVVDHVKSCFPNSPVICVGVSLGGIILGNYLCHYGEAVKDKLEAAMMVSVCFDPFRGTESLERKGLNRMLNRHLANCLVESIKEKKEHFENSIWNLNHVFKSKTIREFDERFTCPQFNYANVNEYYTDAKIKSKIDHIKIPMLALNAEDDAFSPGETLPYEEAKQSDFVALLTTKYGGHIGFMEGILPFRYHFSDRVFEQYARAVFKNEGIC